MWIVRLALRRPLSVAVMALLMLVLGVLSFAMMNVDIFPAINLPVVILIYNYPDLSAVDMERRIVLITERAYSLSVNDIQHIESESIEGLGLELGISENQVASSLLTTLAGNSLIQPTFWLDRNNGVNYYVIARSLISRRVAKLFLELRLPRPCR